MKITNALEFQFLYQKLKDQPINIKLAYKLNKLNNRLIQEVEFYRAELGRILEEYAQTDEQGNYILNEDSTGYLIKEDSIVECHTKVAELQALEIEDINITFNLEEFGDITITPTELSCIISLIAE